MSEAALAEKPSTEIAELDEQSLAEAAVAGIDQEDLVLPVIKITQQMSNEVSKGDAQAGHFINTVTGEDYGDEMDFVIVAYNKGRFYVHNRDEDNEKTYVAYGDTAPDTWPEEYAGRPFVDIEDAEEQWKIQANAEGGSWGRGPKIVTTYNFVGFVAGEAGIPARIGLSRTSAPTAKKILTLMKFAGTSPWKSAVHLSLVSDEKNGKVFYVAKAKAGPQSDNETIEQAKKLAYEVQKAGAFALTGEEVEDADKAKAAKPKAPAGGVEV